MAGDAKSPISGKRLRRTKSIAFVLAAGIGAAAAAWVWQSRAQRPEPVQSAKSTDPVGTLRPTQEQWRTLKLEPVTLRAFLPEQVTEGTIAVDDDLTTPVFSPYSGRVTKVIGMLGDVVEPGAPLFVINASELVQAQNDLITALANLQSSRSQLKMAQTTEKRAHELYLAQGGSLKDWQQAQTDLITALNTVRSNEIALHAVRRRLRILGKTDQEIAALEALPTQKLDSVATVTAPVRGTIMQRQIGVGQYINSEAAGATNPVYTISDLSTVYLIANVREVDAPLMKVGLPLEVHVLAYPGRAFKGKVSYVAPSIDPTTHRLPVRADVENPDGALKPGMFANFSIITGEASTAPAVPPSAIVYEGERARVWVAGEGDTLALREVRTGRISDGMVEIRAGLSPGEKVVTSGTVFIDRAARTD
ncbi:MAG: efflux RND transporter periplasmic adaptor subunit [Alphaproteobacteria bacterium]|nr:efflux RND transporter periplasmic adaptor subunit [Alphaproteobacteria bacterium]